MKTGLGITAALIATTAFLTCIPSAHADVERTVLIGLSNSIVKVITENRGGSISVGTGVVLGRGKVVTNCHVTQKAERIQLLHDGMTWNVTAQASDVQHDLCLLSAQRLDLPAVKVGSATQLKPGDDVAAAGFAFGQRPHFAPGKVVNLHALDNGNVVQTTAQFFPGDSGGALIDRDGKLVGILSFFSPDGPQQFFAVPVDWFVERVNNQQDYVDIAPLAGAPFWLRNSLAELPFFMQAAALEARGDWPQLWSVAQEWLRKEPLNPQARAQYASAEKRIASSMAAADR
jgi:serine protease Do